MTRVLVTGLQLAVVACGTFVVVGWFGGPDPIPDDARTFAVATLVAGWLAQELRSPTVSMRRSHLKAGIACAVLVAVGAAISLVS